MKVVALQYFFVATGGALGAMARFALNVFLQRDIAFPWGTLSANLAGCLVMGAVAQLVATSVWFNETGIVPDPVGERSAEGTFDVAFFPGLTTLSALVMELHTMLQRSELLNSFAYMAATMLGGFACFYMGFMLLRAIR